MFKHLDLFTAEQWRGGTGNLLAAILSPEPTLFSKQALIEAAHSRAPEAGNIQASVMFTVLFLNSTTQQ